MNSRTYTDRILKIKAGFTAGTISTDTINKIIGLFDELDESAARTLADRTRFNVSTLSKIGESDGEARREMTRAALFVDDILTLRQKKSLPAKISDDGFKVRWQKRKDEVKSTLASSIKSLMDTIDQENLMRQQAEERRRQQEERERKAREAEEQRAREIARAHQIEQEERARRIREAEEQRAREVARVKQFDDAVDNMAAARRAQLQPKKINNDFLLAMNRKLGEHDRMTSALKKMADARRGALSPKELTIADDTKLRLGSMMERRLDRIFDVSVDALVIANAQTAWSNAKTRQIAAFATSAASCLSNFASAQTAAKEAYSEFTQFFLDQANEVIAKQKVAEKFFKAVSDYAPWPVSLVGKIGEAIAQNLKVDTDIKQTRDVGGEQYFNSDVPVLSKVKGKVNEILQGIDDARTIGTRSSSLPSSASLHDQIDKSGKLALKLLINSLEASITEIYGDGPEEMNNRCTRFCRSIPGIEKMEPALATTLILKKINDRSDAAIAEFRSMGSAPLVLASDLEGYIELLLMSNYMEAAAPRSTEDFSTFSIPDAMVRRLENAPLNILIRKTSSTKSSAIYAAKKIPWSSHIRHIGAVVLFFRCYQNKIDPFEISAGKKSVAAVENEVRAIITSIGNALETHRINRTLRNDSADWKQVQTALGI